MALSNTYSLSSVQSPAKSGDLIGSDVLPISANKVVKLFRELIGNRVGYGMGCKAKDVKVWYPLFIDQQGQFTHKVDCSGAVRLIAYHASGGAVILPDGSYNQHEAIKALNLRKSNWYACGRKDNLLRIAFHLPDQRDETGHVWFILNGETWESYGGHGPGSRPWLTRILAHLFTDVYVVSETA